MNDKLDKMIQKDPTEQHYSEEYPNDKDKLSTLRCKYCECADGVTRTKEHLIQMYANVVPCKVALEVVQHCKTYLQSKASKKKMNQQNLNMFCNSGSKTSGSPSFSGVRSSKGPSNRFVS